MATPNPTPKETKKPVTRSQNKKSAGVPKKYQDDGETKSGSKSKTRITKKTQPKSQKDKTPMPKIGSVSPELLTALDHMSNGFLLKSDARVIRDFFRYHPYSHLTGFPQESTQMLQTSRRRTL